MTVSEPLSIAIISSVIGPATMLLVGWLLNRKINKVRTSSPSPRHFSR